MKAKKTVFISFLALILFFLLYFVIRQFKSQLKISLAGSTAFLPFAEKLADRYMANHKNIHIDVQGGGSALGIMAAEQGIVDIGMVDMLSIPKEAERLKKVTVARDGIAVIVNLQNIVNNLSMEELAGIFSGSITNWKMLGGDDKPIRVISREEGSGTRKSFDQLVFPGKDLVRQAMFQDSNGTIREAVKSDPQAIGYISIGILDSGVKALKIEGTSATNQNVKEGKYQIARPIYFLLKPPTTKETEGFVDFVLGQKGQQMIEQDGLIPAR